MYGFEQSIDVHVYELLEYIPALLMAALEARKFSGTQIGVRLIEMRLECVLAWLRLLPR